MKGGGPSQTARDLTKVGNWGADTQAGRATLRRGQRPGRCSHKPRSQDRQPHQESDRGLGQRPPASRDSPATPWSQCPVLRAGRQRMCVVCCRPQQPHRTYERSVHTPARVYPCPARRTGGRMTLSQTGEAAVMTPLDLSKGRGRHPGASGGRHSPGDLRVSARAVCAAEPQGPGFSAAACVLHRSRSEEQQSPQVVRTRGSV